MMEYEIVESKHWVNSETKQTASIYGSVPYQDNQGSWEIRTRGYTLRNVKTGIVGIGRQPFKTFEEAENHLKLLS